MLPRNLEDNHDSGKDSTHWRKTTSVRTVQEGMDHPPADTAHSPLPRHCLQTAAAAACRRCCRRRRGRPPRPLDRPATQPVHPAAQAQVVKVTAYCIQMVAGHRW